MQKHTSLALVMAALFSLSHFLFVSSSTFGLKSGNSLRTAQTPSHSPRSFLTPILFLSSLLLLATASTRRLKPKEVHVPVSSKSPVVGSLGDNVDAVIMPGTGKSGWSAHLQIQTGSIDESQENSGLSHLLEHVALMSQQAPPGVRVNASTDFHEIVFEASDENNVTLEAGLQFLRRCVAGEISAQILEREKQVVKMEQLQTDTPEYRLDCEILRFMHGERFTRTPIGDMNVVAGVDVDKLEKFRASLGHARLFVSAQADQQDVLKAVTAVFKADFAPADSLRRVQDKTPFSTLASQVKLLDSSVARLPKTPFLVFVRKEELRPDDAEHHVTRQIALTVLQDRLKKFSNKLPVHVEAESTDSAQEGAHVTRILAKTSDEDSLPKVAESILNLVTAGVTAVEFNVATNAFAKNMLAGDRQSEDLTPIVDAVSCGHRPRTAETSKAELSAALSKLASLEVEEDLKLLAGNFSILSNANPSLKDKLENALLQRPDLVITRSEEASDFRFSWKSGGRVYSAHSSAAATVAQLLVNTELVALGIDAFTFVNLNDASIVASSVDDFNRISELSVSVSEEKLRVVKEKLKLFLLEPSPERKAADMLFRRMFTSGTVSKLCEPTVEDVDAVELAEVEAAVAEVLPRGRLEVTCPANSEIAHLRRVSRLREASPEKGGAQFFADSGSVSRIVDGSAKALILVGGEVSGDLDEGKISEELLGDLRETQGAVYDVNVVKTRMGESFFAVVAAQTDIRKAEQVRESLEKRLRGVFKAAHVVIAEC